MPANFASAAATLDHLTGGRAASASGRLKVLSRERVRDLSPLEFGLRITTLVGGTTGPASAMPGADDESDLILLAEGTP
ncbi:hypothetical protein [Rhizobium mesoamericanum]|uniref:hypothetical protein n=1 Tax=Rhizobium mesoamericanum TaxID=1079800 RepID=UPI0004270BB7